MSDRPVRAGTVIAGLLLAIVLSILADALVAAVAHALGAPQQLPGLTLPMYGLFTTVGILVGTAVWAVIRRWAARPAAILRWLVPVAIVLTLIPDVLVGRMGVPAVGVAALMAMHVVVAVISVPTLARILPLADRTRSIATASAN
jgi:Family of unknown function (DUF6069)